MLFFVIVKPYLLIKNQVKPDKNKTSKIRLFSILLKHFGLKSSFLKISHLLIYIYNSIRLFICRQFFNNNYITDISFTAILSVINLDRPTHNKQPTDGIYHLWAAHSLSYSLICTTSPVHHTKRSHYTISLKIIYSS